LLLFAAAAVTWATARTAQIPLVAGIPLRAGQARRLYSVLFNRRVTVRSEHGDRTTPWTEILLDYARVLGGDDAPAQPTFAPTASDEAEAGALLRERSIDGPFALLHPTRGLSAQRERWPAAGFVALARAYGLAAWKVAATHEFAAALAAARAHAGPALIELVTSIEDISPGRRLEGTA